MEYGWLPFLLKSFHRYARELGQRIDKQSVLAEIRDDMLAGETQFRTQLKEKIEDKAKSLHRIVNSLINCNYIN